MIKTIAEFIIALLLLLVARGAFPEIPDYPGRRARAIALGFVMTCLWILVVNSYDKL